MSDNRKSLRETYLSHIISGVFKGIVTTLSVVASAHAAQLSPNAIIIIGFAALITNGFLLSVSTYLATETEKQQNGAKDKDEIVASMITFFSVFIAGLIPLLGFILERFMGVQSGIAYIISAILAFIALFFSGALKAKQLCQSPIHDGVELLLLGIFATAMAYIIGLLLKPTS